MFLKPRRATQGAVAIATIGALALSGCEDKVARTDLRPEGPPDVLAVLVLNDSVNGLVEAATFCKDGDEKRPSIVGLPDFTTTVLCPEDLSATQPMAEDASPDTFYVRIMFDELLDPTVEDLLPILDENGLETGSFTGTIAQTQPVTLKCTGVDGALHDVPYDGYYSPSGNAVTWPVGPSLVIKQVGDFIIPTNSACEVTIKDSVHDKSGNPVPADQRGPFKFKVSGLKPLANDPADDTVIDAIQMYFDNPFVQFNAEVDIASLCPDEGGNGLCDSDTTAFDITPHVGGYCDDAVADPCNTDADCTGVTCDYLYAYSYAPFGGTPAEFGFGAANPVETEKMYTITLKQGVAIKDQCSAPTTLGAPDVDKLTQATITTRKFGLRNTTPTVPNNGDIVSANRKVDVAFNNVIDFASLALTEWSITPQVFIPPTTTVCVDNTGCAGFRGGGGECRDFGGATGKRCVNNYTTTAGNDGDIIFRGVFAMNTEYTFTLNAGATVEDAYGKVFTNETARVIKFKTQPAVAITASAPATGAEITKASPTSKTNIDISFNQAMVPASLEPADYTITPAVTLDAPITTATTGCTASGTSCTIRLGGTYPPGTYTFTLKAGAVINDLLGNPYTQPNDRVIKFTVKEAPPAPVIPCLGA
jgi:Bacterial Ig-like domain